MSSNVTLPIKKVIHAGKGDTIDFQNGFKAIFHYRAESVSENDDRERMCVDDSRKPYPDGYGKPMEIIFGKKFRLPIWETCLQTMRVDEVAEFVLPAGEILDFPFVSKQLRDISKESLIKSHHDDKHTHGRPAGHTCMGLAVGGLGYPILDEWLRKPTPVIFTFHLLRVLSPDQYERESWTLNAEEKLDSLDQLRTEGNDFFKSGQLEQACNRYCEALSRLDILISAEKPGEPEYLALDKRKALFYTNIAECKLKLSQFYAAIEACNEALERQPDNVKALFRRAKAHVGAWNLDEAVKDFGMAAQFDPTLANTVKKELEHLQDLAKQKKESDSQLYKKVMGNS